MPPGNGSPGSCDSSTLTYFGSHDREYNPRSCTHHSKSAAGDLVRHMQQVKVGIGRTRRSVFTVTDR